MEEINIKSNKHETNNINIYFNRICFLANINVSTAQRIFVNDVDINELDIEYVELSVTSKLLNPTKMKIYVDYGQKWSMKS
jgi:hypothetical protein